MRFLTLAIVGILLVTTALGLLWATDILVGDELRRVAGYSYGGLIVLLLGAIALRAVAGRPAEPDKTDRPVP